jgi:membrane protease YdiL (CAAX protease family)
VLQPYAFVYVRKQNSGNFVAVLMAFDPVTNTLLSLLVETPSSLLQVIAFLLTWAGCWLPVAIVYAIALDCRAPKPLVADQKLPLLALLYLIAPLVVARFSQVAGASFSDYGLAWNPWILLSLGLGFGLGMLSLGVLFGIQTALGWMSWQSTDGRRLGTVLLPTLLLALWISGTEELVFRGFLLNQLQQDFSGGAAAAISSLIFALLHLIWERRETIPQLPGLWLMGMVLVLARWLDNGSLGLAWGLHTGWVWAMVSLDSVEMITYTGIGAEWVTGKNGKPLAGAAGIICLLATGVVLWLFSGK